MVETLTCAECGEPIEAPDVPVRMAKQVETESSAGGAPQWRDGLVFVYHVDCAPGELVGAWRRVG
jgi:hypothetical protein